MTNRQNAPHIQALSAGGDVLGQWARGWRRQLPYHPPGKEVLLVSKRHIADAFSFIAALLIAVSRALRD